MRGLAARQVGPTGGVIGVDMTHEMLKSARENAGKVAANVDSGWASPNICLSLPVRRI